MDTQIIEILGKNKLVSEILKSGLEIAMPQRDRGIDIIAYTGFSDSNEFIAKPIQMKASMNKSFGLWKKYAKFNNLIMTYIWNIDDEKKCKTYALTYIEAFEICKKMGWTETLSWKNGGYSTSNPNKKLLELLKEYRMSPEKWAEKICRKFP